MAGDERDNATTLNRLRGRVKPRKIVAVDIETFQWNTPYALGVYDGEDYWDFFGDDCIEKGLAFLFTPQFAGSWIYAHNGGKFDFGFFLPWLTAPEQRDRFETEIIPSGSSMISISVKERHGKGVFGGATKRMKGGKELKWTFVDSLRLMPIKLDSLGVTFGLGKKVSLPMTYDELAQPKNWPVAKKYLRKDCTLVFDAVTKMQEIINALGGNIGLTGPSTSLDLFRRKYLHEKIYTNRHWRKCPEYGKEYKKGMQPSGACRSCLHQFVRQSYFGGRTEIFRMNFMSRQWMDEAREKLEDPFASITAAERKLIRDQLKLAEKMHDDDISETPAYLFDINSHYPAMMLKPMPVGQAIEMEALSEEHIFSNARRFTGFVECEVWIPEDCYIPPLPVVAKTDHNGKLVEADRTRMGDGKLIFPVGRFSGVWDTAELVLLKKVGGKILSSKRSVWMENEQVFEPFIRQLFKFRDKTQPDWDVGMDFIAKILMNSAYGKFVMREQREKIVVAPANTHNLTAFNFDANIWKEDVELSPSYIVPQLSAHITSLARARLWEIMTDVIAKGGRVYYTDTDSVVCSGVNLDTNAEIGGLKKENTITRATFTLPKLYLVETTEPNKKKKAEQNVKVKAKGMGAGITTTKGTRIWKSAHEACTSRDDVEDILDGQLAEMDFHALVREGYVVTRYQLTQLKTNLKNMTNQACAFPRIVETTKAMRTRYDKRKILDDYNTSPLVF